MRGPGEGSIYRRGDGRWVAAVGYVGMDGRRQRRASYYHTRVEAQDGLLDLRLAARNGELEAPPEHIRLAEFLTRWLVDVVDQSCRPLTAALYESAARVHIIPELGGTELRRLTPLQIQAWVNRAARTLSPARVRTVHSILRAALAQAVQWGMIERNPALGIRLPRNGESRAQFLSPEEAGRFLAAARGERLEALFVTALGLGLRRGELMGLRWEDVNLEAGRLSIAQTIQTIDGIPTVQGPKTARGARTLGIPALVVEALRRHRVSQARERLAAGPAWRGNGLVFCGDSGGPIGDTALRNALRRVLRRADLPPMRLHDLRHSCASLLVAQGVHPRIIMETLGHSDIGITMNLYAHVGADTQGEAARAMERAFSAAG